MLSMLQLLLLSMLAGVIGLLFSYYLIRKIMKKDRGTKRMIEIGDAIQEGAMAFLKREYRAISIIIVVVAIVIGYFINYMTAVAFVFGALCSIFAGYIGMRTAVRANTRTANAAKESVGKALGIAFSSGTVTGITVVSVGIIGIGILFLVTMNPFVIAGFGFGASCIALFMRVGGGIFTKAADVGADLVGKVEEGIPEDDPRNPAVIADNVGDNVGDVAGMSADLFESYASSIIAVMALSVTVLSGMMLPILIAAGGLIASIIGTFFVRVGKKADTGDLLNALRRGVFISSILIAIFSFLIIYYLNYDMGIFYAILTGLVAGILIGLNTEYFTSSKYKPTKDIAKTAQTGAGTTIIKGFSNGMLSTVLPVIIIAISILLSYYFAGLYGIAISAVGMLSTLGITLASDAYGAVADNSGGIVEMSGAGDKIRKRTDALDALGNTVAATGKGFAIGSAVLTALALLVAYSQVVNITVISMLDAKVLVGIIIGAMLPFLFCALVMSAVGKAASDIVNEVRRQFRNVKIRSGRAKPNYTKCVDISTKRALNEMIVPGLIAIIMPIFIGIVLGPAALGGMLVGSIATGFLLAVTMANAGASWDNAKKYIEQGNFGGKGSFAHKSAVVGDTVGDPFKDTAGPSLNILIKLMAIVSIVFAPLFLAIGTGLI